MPEDILIRLGRRMKAARKSRGFTQDELSIASGVSTRHISNIEKGAMNPSFEVLYQLISVMGISFDYFFSETDDEDEENIQKLACLYKSCPGKYKDFFMGTVQTIAKEIKELDRK